MKKKSKNQKLNAEKPNRRTMQHKLKWVSVIVWLLFAYNSSTIIAMEARQEEDIFLPSYISQESFYQLLNLQNTIATMALPTQQVSCVYDSLSQTSINKLYQLAEAAEYFSLQTIVYSCLLRLRHIIIHTAESQPSHLLSLMKQIHIESHNLYRKLVSILTPCSMVQAIWASRQSPITMGNPTTNPHPHQFVWSPDDTKIAFINEDEKNVEIWDVSTNTLLHKLYKPQSKDPNDYKNYYRTIYSLSWSPDGTKIASGAFANNANKIQVWDASTGMLIIEFPINFFPLRISWSTDSTKIAFGANLDDIHILNTTTGTRVDMPLNNPNKSVTTSLIWSPDGTKIAASGPGSNFYIWDVLTGTLLHTLTEFPGDILSIAWSPDNTKIAAAWSSDISKLTDNFWKINIWDASMGTLTPFSTSEGSIMSVAWSHDNTKIAAASSDKIIRIWHAATGQLLNRFSLANPSGYVAFSPNSTKLAVDQPNNTVKIFTLRDPALDEECANLNLNQISSLLVYFYQASKQDPKFDWHQYPDLLEIAYKLPENIKNLFNLPPKSAEYAEQSLAPSPDPAIEEFILNFPLSNKPIQEEKDKEKVESEEEEKEAGKEPDPKRRRTRK